MLSLLLLGLALALGPRTEAASRGFEQTGSLNQPRAFHPAVLLPNGKVLVPGPVTSSGQPGSELYDPATRTWTYTGSHSPRNPGYTATLLPDGKVLIAGGTRGFNTLATAELYDPASGTWTPTGSMKYSRREHTATLLPDGKVLVAGGFLNDPFSITGGSALSSAELYDPATGTWTETTSSMVKQRYRHTATLLANGKVLVAAGTGYPQGSSVHESAELYDPASGTWTLTGGLNNARHDHTATLLPGDKVLVAGGYAVNTDNTGPLLASAEIYDSATGTWTTTGSLARARIDHTATLLPDNKVLVAGGYDGNYPNGTLASAELFDPGSGTWSATGSMHTARQDHSATLLSDGTVLVAGGRVPRIDGNTYLNSAELYVQSTPTLLNISTRAHVLNGDKVLIAGFIITGPAQKTVVVRGIGPSLPLAGKLSDPVIEVHGPSGELLGVNDDWEDALTRQEISDSGFAPTNRLESALWGVINPGAYTVILTGKDGGTGIGSVEVYDLDEPADSRLANISTRGFVDTGDNAMIGGLIVGGGNPTGAIKVVVRALGPSIPLADALANPTVELHDKNGTTIASNDDWKMRPDGTSQQAEIEATTIPPPNDLESAFVETLPPGQYTAIVRGKNGTTGIGLVEAYHLP